MLQFEWMNENSIEKSGDCWKIFASPKSDFFCNNETVGKEGIYARIIKQRTILLYGSFWGLCYESKSFT